MIVNLIVARSRNNVIGKAGKIPWKIRGEQIQFRELTTGNAIVMGRRTYEDIGHPLPGRLNIVVSNTRDFGTMLDFKELTTLLTMKSLQEAVDDVEGMDGVDLYVSGGRSLYEEAIPLVDRMYITEVDTEVEDEGDCVYFPPFNEDEFEKLTGETVEGEIPYTRTVYIRKTSKDRFCMTGAQGLDWAESCLSKNDVAKIHASLPGNIGNVTISEKKHPRDGKPDYFTVHFQIRRDGGYCGFSGMKTFDGVYTSLDEVKADIHHILRKMFREKRDDAEIRMRSADRALRMIQTPGNTADKKRRLV